MKERWVARITAAGMLLFLLGACDRDDDDEEDLPDTTGAAIWEHIQGENYRQNWHLWPGMGELYEGSDPHGMLLTTYLNQAAMDALTGRAGEMPHGAIIIKENYMPDSTFDGLTTMYKFRGYNPEFGDWFWVKQDPTGLVDVEGRVAMCQGCHAQVADNDFVFTGPLD